MTTDNIRHIFSNEAELRRILRPDSSGGGSGGEGMEARLSRLENGVDKIDDRLRGVEINLATLNEKVAHLPSKGYILTVVVGVGGLLGAITLFTDQIKALFGS